MRGRQLVFEEVWRLGRELGQGTFFCRRWETQSVCINWNGPSRRRGSGAVNSHSQRSSHPTVPPPHPLLHFPEAPPPSPALGLRCSLQQLFPGVNPSFSPTTHLSDSLPSKMLPLSCHENTVPVGFGCPQSPRAPPETPGFLPGPRGTGTSDPTSCSL